MPNDEDTQLAWSRWYRRAILKSVKQIRGAERWIAAFPERIFLDRGCTQPFPLVLPSVERRKIHGIVVALGAGDACKRHLGEDLGSLFIAPDIKGNAHWKDRPIPFAVGDVDPDGSFIHVLDDATLDIVMHELDTMTDFTTYLTKKEQLIRSGRLIAAIGEEELVAYYTTHMNQRGEHDFTKPDGSDLTKNQKLCLDRGFYADLMHDERYLQKREPMRFLMFGID